MKNRSTSHLHKVSRVLGTKTFGAISAVEGLRLQGDSKTRVERLVTSDLSPDARRDAVLKAYSGKGRK